MPRGNTGEGKSGGDVLYRLYKPIYMSSVHTGTSLLQRPPSDIIDTTVNCTVQTAITCRVRVTNEQANALCSAYTRQTARQTS